VIGALLQSRLMSDRREVLLKLLERNFKEVD